MRLVGTNLWMVWRGKSWRIAVTTFWSLEPLLAWSSCNWAGSSPDHKQASNDDDDDDGDDDDDDGDDGDDDDDGRPVVA